MSHTSVIDAVKITDINALKAAVEELRKSGIDIKLVKGGTPRAFFANQTGLGPADYVLHLGGSPYDVGLYLNPESKSYEARTDLYGGYVAKVLGAKAQGKETAGQASLGRLYQGYAIHAAMRQAAKQGYTVSRVNGKDGSVKLVLGGM